MENLLTNKKAYITLIILCLIHFVSFFDRIIISFIFVPIQSEFQVTDTQLGLLAGPAFAITYMLSSIPLGYCVDRFNRVAIILAGLIAWSAMTLLSGFAVTFAMLVLCRAAVGIGEAVLMPSASSIINDSFDSEARPFAFGLFFTAAASSILVSFVFGSAIVYWLSQHEMFDLPVIGPIQSWRSVLLVSAAVGLVLAPIAYMLMREPARSSDSAKRGNGSGGGLAYLRANWRVVLAIVAGAPLLNSGLYTFINWMAVFFQRVHDWPPTRAGLMFGLICGVAAIIGSVTTGFLPRYLRKKGIRSAYPITCLIIGVGVNALGALAMLAANPWLAIALLAGAFTGMMSVSVLAMSMIGEIVPSRFRGTFTGLLIVGSGVLTNAAGPLIAGHLSDSLFVGPTGISSALAVVWLVALVLGGGLLALGLPRYNALLRQPQMPAVSNDDGSSLQWQPQTIFAPGESK